MATQLKKKSIFSNVHDLLGLKDTEERGSPGVLDLSVKHGKATALHQPTPLLGAVAPVAFFPEQQLAFYQQLTAESRKLSQNLLGPIAMPAAMAPVSKSFACPSLLMLNLANESCRPLHASFSHKMSHNKPEPPSDTTLYQFKLPAHPPSTLSLMPSGSKSSSAARQAPRFQCPDCSRSYSTFSGLSKHRQFHCTSQLKRQFGCKFCDKQYSSLGALKMHIRTHTLPCKCEICGKAFSRPWLLQGHLRTHTGEKPFRCGHCGRAFADRSNLRAHLQTHSEIKKYRCKTCQKTFSRMSLLNKHENNGCPGLMM